MDTRQVDFHMCVYLLANFYHTLSLANAVALVPAFCKRQDSIAERPMFSFRANHHTF